MIEARTSCIEDCSHKEVDLSARNFSNFWRQSGILFTIDIGADLVSMHQKTEQTSITAIIPVLL
jgi:hypothetical protein